MQELKPLGGALLILSALEVYIWRFLAPKNPKLAPRTPLLLLSAVVTGLAGLALLTLG